jgi:putative membrane protein
VGGFAEAYPVIETADLPAVSATLNGTTAVLLACGYAMIRRRRIRLHRACMLSALGVSTLFLASYLWYHAHAGMRHFQGRGWIRPVYFAILISHTVLAAVIVPLALTTVYFGLRARHPTHQRIARWTLPIWLYVSVTGVVVYLLLYRLFSS